MLRSVLTRITQVICKPTLPGLPKLIIERNGLKYENFSTNFQNPIPGLKRVTTPDGWFKPFNSLSVMASAGFHNSSPACGNSLNRMHRTGPIFKKRSKKNVLDGKPQMRGVVLKTLIKKPKKPNSANRKCVLLRLSNGKEAVAYVPGIGHNLQEHNVVLVEVKRLQDVPGVKLKVIRGVYDCAHVKPTTIK